MCGITGYYSPHKCEFGPDRIVEMTELIRHRGPDDEGYVFIDTSNNVSIDASGKDSPNVIKEKFNDAKSLRDVSHNIAFGHRRYSIIDLSPGGHQPFWDETHSVCTSFNGEIYNYIEVKAELEKKGYKFATASDTEVLVYAYREWGEGCFAKFNGTWALSLYDANKRKLLLSRDRIGKSPLYYTIRNDTLYWSSEIKSLLHVCGMNAFSINKQAIHDFIIYNLRDFDNNTFWNEIHTLPAATYVWIDDSLNFQENVYWTIPQERLQSSEISFKDAEKQLRNLLTEALDIRLRSDIPVGFALSGGMDSSSLIALYTQVLKKKTVSFTVKFTQKGTNEEPFARMVAERCGKFVDYKVIEPSCGDFWKDANDYVWLMEEPFHSPTTYIEQLLQKRLKSEGFGVIINGNGGDELLAGYEYLYFSPYIDYIWHNKRSLFVKELFSWMNKDLSALDRIVRALFVTKSIKKFVNRSRRKKHFFLKDMSDIEERHLPHDFNKLMIGNMGQWLMNYWLRSGNKSYFAVPMETRSPFLDYKLVDFAFRLPLEYLIHNGWHKYILRKSVEDLLPKEVTWRKNKMGFPFPYREWLESSKGIIEKNVRNVDCPYVDIENLLSKYDDMAKSDPTLLWRYVSLILWWKRVVMKDIIVI